MHSATSGRGDVANGVRNVIKELDVEASETYSLEKGV
jgi:hypothetical protein